MEAHNYFTCIAYDSVDFLIQSKYVVFGLYLAVESNAKNIIFNSEKLPHISLGSFLENTFSCKSLEDCTTVLIMRRSDFPADVQNEIQKYTGTAFPLSGNFALSVNSLISSKDIEISTLHLIPEGIRKMQNDCGICAIGFVLEENSNEITKRILLTPDNLLRKLLSCITMGEREG